ncbi:hypothetical protein FRB94_003481 [Tulasnella sp. JGI-2019a]|nr:hypothetical protein FRB94_003481 [Tulasnella sp. JGI-2019a]
MQMLLLSPVLSCGAEPLSSTSSTSQLIMASGSEATGARVGSRGRGLWISSSKENTEVKGSDSGGLYIPGLGEGSLSLDRVPPGFLWDSRTRRRHAKGKLTRGASAERRSGHSEYAARTLG